MRTWMGATVVAVLLVTGMLSFQLLRLDGDLHYDDTAYLGQGISYARSLLADEEPLFPHLLWYLKAHEQNWPPLLVGWVASVSYFAYPSVKSILLLSAVFPVFILLCTLAILVSRLGDWRAACLSVLLWGAMPIAFQLGRMTMVATWLSLWVLLILYFAARLVEKPGSWTAQVGISVAFALALLTKFTLWLFLPVAGAWVLVALFRASWTQLFRAGMILAAVTATICGWWYGAHFLDVLDYAVYSSNYQNEAGAARSATSVRLQAVFGGQGLLWAWIPVLACVLPSRNTVFPRMVLGTFGVALAVLMIPSYFEARFLAPMVPALAAAAALTWPENKLPSAFSLGILSLALFLVAGREIRATGVSTPWGLVPVMDTLGGDHRPADRIAVIGSRPAFNFWKLKMLNALTEDPYDRVLRHVAELVDDEADLLMAKCRYVIAPQDLPAYMRENSPALNRQYDRQLKLVRSSDAWMPITNKVPDGVLLFERKEMRDGAQSKP